MDLTLVLPARDEAESLPSVIRDAHAAFDEAGLEAEVLVVDDGSADATPRVLAGLAGPRLRSLRLDPNRGRAHAMAAGMARARGCAVAVMDADGQYDPRDLPAMLGALHAGADVVNGRRVDRADGAWRRFVSAAYNALVIRAVLDGAHADANSGLKVVRRDALDRLAFEPARMRRAHRFLVPWAEARGLRVVEVPVRHYPRVGGRSYIRAAREARLTLRDLAVFRRLLAEWEPATEPVSPPSRARRA
jgi:dolichol-phosphate mannosyltransferase